jgi:trk system potassium uptake protein TrkA
VHLLDLPAERLEIIEIEVTPNAPAAARAVIDIDIPEGSLIISVLRGGEGFVPKADTVIQAGDEVLLVLDPGLETAITEQFAPAPDGAGRPA